MYTWFQKNQDGTLSLFGSTNQVISTTGKIPSSPAITENQIGTVIFLSVQAKTSTGITGNILEASIEAEAVESITADVDIVEVTGYFPVKVRATANYTFGRQLDITDSATWTLSNGAFTVDKGVVNSVTKNLTDEATLTISYKGKTKEIPVKFIEAKTTGVLGSASDYVNPVLMAAEDFPELRVYVGNIVDAFRGPDGKTITGGFGGKDSGKRIYMNKLKRIKAITSTNWNVSKGVEYMVRLEWEHNDSATVYQAPTTSQSNILPTGGGEAIVTKKIYGIIGYNNNPKSYGGDGMYMTGIEIIYY